MLILVTGFVSKSNSEENVTGTAINAGVNTESEVIVISAGAVNNLALTKDGKIIEWGRLNSSYI